MTATKYTADNLRQIASLHDTHPALASCAREAVNLLLRPPVVAPVKATLLFQIND